MAKYEGWTIRTGFLAGNLFAESGDDRGTYDVDASAARYAEMCREELEKEFPGAAVEVPYERRASGATPIPLQTLVTDSEGVHYRPGDYGRGGRIAERVEEVCGEVWESWEWVVYETETVHVVNPWTGALVSIAPEDLTPEKLEAMAVFLPDDIREELHREYMSDPWSFWAAYVNRVGPEEAGKLWFS